MSSQQVQVASLLLQESFGELVEKVGGFLLQRGASNLAEIIRGTELEPTLVASWIHVHAPTLISVLCGIFTCTYRVI